MVIIDNLDELDEEQKYMVLQHLFEEIRKILIHSLKIKNSCWNMKWWSYIRKLKWNESSMTMKTTKNIREIDDSAMPKRKRESKSKQKNRIKDQQYMNQLQQQHYLQQLALQQQMYNQPIWNLIVIIEDCMNKFE